MTEYDAAKQKTFASLKQRVSSSQAEKLTQVPKDQRPTFALPELGALHALVTVPQNPSVAVHLSATAAWRLKSHSRGKSGPPAIQG